MFHGSGQPTANPPGSCAFATRTTLQIQQPGLVVTVAGAVFASIDGELFISWGAVVERHGEIVVNEAGSILHPGERSCSVGGWHRGAPCANSGGRCRHPRLAVYRLRAEEHTPELQSRGHLVCRLLL